MHRRPTELPPLLLLLLLPLLLVAAAAPAQALLPTPTGPAAPPAPAWPGLLHVELEDGPLVAGITTAIEAVPGVLASAPTFAASEALDRWLTIEVQRGLEARVAAALTLVPGVASAARVPVRVPAYRPNDPDLPRQWHLTRIGADAGWTVSRGDRRVRVGVIDTQFDTGHPELRDALFRSDGKRGVEELAAGCRKASAYSEHGTFVAGIAAAATDNGVGVASVGFGIGIVAVQAGTEMDGTCLISPRWSSALVDLADAGVPVVNLSFAGAGASATEAAAIRYATARGTLVVAAAGNNGSTVPHFPAADPLVLGVAATDQGDRLWGSSNRGPWVDVAAPGVSLLSVCPDGYCHVTGTSASAPVVSSIAALLAGTQPDLRGMQLRLRVVDAAAEVTGVPLDPAIGYGRVRLDRTLTQRSVRLYGRDRTETARAVAREANPGGGTAVTRVLLVPADTPGDRGWTVTLPAAGLLADGRTAMVMTPRDRLSAEVLAELRRLLGGPGEILLPGAGQLGVTAGVEDELRRRGHTVERVGTADHIGTAALLADEVLDSNGTHAALVANGSSFADSLSLAGAAAAHGYPLLLVERDAVPAATCDWIRDHASVTTLHLAGGPQAIAPAVEQALQDCTRGLLVGRPLTITRDAGSSRVETSIAVARRHFGSSVPVVAIANGYRWPDAVTGGALAQSVRAPVLLTGGAGALEPAVRAHLRSVGTRSAYVLGGTAVVADTTRASLEGTLR